MPKGFIYLDNAATSIVNPLVLDSYNQVVKEYIANPSSIHFEGAKAKRLLDASREQILKLLNVESTHDLTFTSGATEANNIAIKGYARKYKNRGNHLITSLTEHPAVLECFKVLESEGFNVTYLKPNSEGVITLENLKDHFNNDTILVSLMAVNNETGAINEIEKIASYLKDFPKVMFHCDTTQAIGKVKIDYKDVDALAFSSHKIHGLKSSGALIKKKSLSLEPIVNGGGQENNLRSGTNDLGLAVATAKALRLVNEEFTNNISYISLLNNKVRDYLLSHEDQFIINSNEKCSPFIINFSCKIAKASVVVEGLSNKGIMVSSTSACHSKGEPISNVVLAMTDDVERSANTIRVSFDKENNMDEIETFLKNLDLIIKEVKAR